MPKCVDCGAETERESMFGPRDDLRCWACVQKIQERYDPFTPQFRPTMERPPVVIALIAGAAVCTLLYWARSPIALNYLLANRPPIWDGQIWRFLTAALIHGNAIHLLFNLYMLWTLGKATEEWMGSLLFAGFVVVTALGSSAAQFLIGGSGIGLSGVVYALFGFLYALRWYKDFAAALIQPQVIKIFVGWFFLGIIVTYLNIYPIGNTAHGAGAVIGFLFGKAVLAAQRKALVPGVVVLVGLLTASVYTPWQPQYAAYQGYQAIQRRDFPAALTWFRRASLADPSNEGLRRQVELLEQLERLDEKQ
jgi:GlpG protein